MERNLTMERKLWMRLGVSLRITPTEEAVIFGSDRRKADDLLQQIIAEGRFSPNGDSYIPGDTVEEYNREHGTNYEVGDIEFDLPVRRRKRKWRTSCFFWRIRRFLTLF